jgi:hypothetical protein
VSLKTRAALTYLLPLLLCYVGAVVAISVGSRPNWPDLIARATPSAGLLVIAHLLQDIVPKAVKEAFVFFRVRNRLPSSRAYTELAMRDNRVSAAFVEKVSAQNDLSPTAQSARWFEIYNKIRDRPQIKHANLRYLAWRDGAAASLVLALATPVLGAASILAWTEVAYLSGGCTAAAFLIAQAARNMANELVIEVVALEAVGVVN